MYSSQAADYNDRGFFCMLNTLNLFIKYPSKRFDTIIITHNIYFMYKHTVQMLWRSLGQPLRAFQIAAIHIVLTGTKHEIDLGFNTFSF